VQARRGRATVIRRPVRRRARPSYVTFRPTGTHESRRRPSDIFLSAHPMTAADACPGILDLHEARDGHVARIRLPGGYASAARLRALAAMAARFGDGHVDLTARGNVQLRGIRAGQAGELARGAASAGFLPSPAHDRARNITASPLAGLAGHPDLRTLVRSLDRAVRADPGLAALPGRFLFCLDDGTGRAGLSNCDVGLRWRPQGAELIVGGRQTGLRGTAAQGIGHAIAAARAFLGQRPAVPASARVTGLPDHGARVAAAIGGSLGERVTDTTARLPLGPVPDAALLAVVAAPLARLTAPQLRLIARLVRPGEVARLTAAGRIVLPLTRPVDAAIPQLAAAGFLVSDDHVLSAVTACSGMTCASSLADVRSLAARVPGLAAVHWAGCSRRCGRPADATAVVATSASQFTFADGNVQRVLTVAPRSR
jgi:precorrin-3B synthase